MNLNKIMGHSIQRCLFCFFAFSQHSRCIIPELCTKWVLEGSSGMLDKSARFKEKRQHFFTSAKEFYDTSFDEFLSSFRDADVLVENVKQKMDELVNANDLPSDFDRATDEANAELVVQQWMEKSDEMLNVATDAMIEAHVLLRDKGVATKHEFFLLPADAAANWMQRITDLIGRIDGMQDGDATKGICVELNALRIEWSKQFSTGLINAMDVLYKRCTHHLCGNQRLIDIFNRFEHAAYEFLQVTNECSASSSAVDQTSLKRLADNAMVHLQAAPDFAYQIDLFLVQEGVIFFELATV